MPSIGINIYSFRVFDVNGNQLNLNNLVENKSIVDVFREFIESRVGNFKNNSSKEQIYTFEDYEVVQEEDKQGFRYLQYLYGRMRTGNYGVETDIVDITTGTLAHRQTVNEAGLKPFDLIVTLPEDSCDETIVVLQTISNYGIKSLLLNELNSFVKEKYNLGYVFFGTIYPREFVQKYIKDGVTKRMRLLNSNLPSDIADMYGVNRSSKRTKKETIITCAGGFKDEIMQKIEECVKGHRSYYEIIDLGPDEEYDDIKLDICLAGKKKTISLKNLEKIVVSEDITSKVRTVNGNPVKESIKEIMVLQATDYLIEKGLVDEVPLGNNEIISSFAREDDGNEGDSR